MYKETRYLTSGDGAITVEFDSAISLDANIKVRGLADAISSVGFEGLIEVVPTYRSVTVHYDPLVITYEEVIEYIKKTEDKSEGIKEHKSHIIEIPVCYEDEYGPDLCDVASHNNISIEEVIRRHSSPDYLIYMIGFTPGFPYLGGMDKTIATPRLSKPRLKIEAGSVGIAGEQTGIYPVDSPGGWRIIGKTPLKLYDKDLDTPVLLDMGDYLRFIPIDKDEFERISRSVANGKYNLIKYPKGGI